ncbi:hypothetical protein ATX08_10865, partial [Oenococcus oeni]
MPFFVIKKGLVLLEWKYFPTPKILDPFLSVILASSPEEYLLTFAMTFPVSKLSPSHSAINFIHGIFKTLAADLVKIGNDIRFLASGPRSGYGEINIPA